MGDAAADPSLSSALRLARERVRDGLSCVRATSASCTACFRAAAVARFGGGSATPARRALESPIAITCIAERAPCLPARTWSISSRTNAPARVLGDLPSRLSSAARWRVVFFDMSRPSLARLSEHASACLEHADQGQALRPATVRVKSNPTGAPKGVRAWGLPLAATVNVAAGSSASLDRPLLAIVGNLQKCCWTKRIRGPRRLAFQMAVAIHPKMEPWPELPIAAWRDSYATLHLYTQVVGKIRLALTPKTNQWWNVPLYVTTRGLTTAPMTHGDRTLSIEFDFIEHRLHIQDSDGHLRILPLVAQSVRDFYLALFAELAAIDVHVKIHPVPQECPVTSRFADDIEHASYDPERVHACWQVLRRIEPVFQIFRARFRGKCSPVHFFWGAFDLAVSRFNGQRAPARQARIDRDAYDEEVISLGFWPGDPWTGGTDAMFYSYTVPEPLGLRSQRVRPDGAFFSEALGEFVLPYEGVRRSPDPARAILDFAESTYDVGSTLAGWNRSALAYP